MEQILNQFLCIVTVFPLRYVVAHDHIKPQMVSDKTPHS